MSIFYGDDMSKSKHQKSLRFERNEEVWLVDAINRNIRRMTIKDATVNEDSGGPFSVTYYLEDDGRLLSADEKYLFEIDDTDGARKQLLSILESDLKYKIALRDEAIKQCALVEDKIANVKSDRYFVGRR